MKPRRRRKRRSQGRKKGRKEGRKVWDERKEGMPFFFFRGFGILGGPEMSLAFLLRNEEKGGRKEARERRKEG
jgi:hypothetical protein